MHDKSLRICYILTNYVHTAGFRFVPNTYTVGEANIVQVCIQLSGGTLSQNMDLTITTSNLQAIGRDTVYCIHGLHYFYIICVCSFSPFSWFGFYTSQYSI